MLRIICTGDSHTWGQGAANVVERFDPPVVAGDLRPIDFDTDSYVNHLRRMVESATGAKSFQWTAQEIANKGQCPYIAPCAELDHDFEMDVQGALLRIVIGPHAEPVHWDLSVSGESRVLQFFPSESSNDFRILTLHLPEGNHTLTLKKRSGNLHLYRVESYSGPAAVINCGIGSCPTFKFRELYWDDYVVSLKPDIVLAEAHTINDWLTGDTPETYRKNLANLLKDFRSLGAETVLMTVAPIGGPQKLPYTASDYQDYIEASRLAATDSGAILCDANYLMTIATENMSPEVWFDYLLDDNWHPNDRGHHLYSALLAQTLGQIVIKDKCI